jgi:putative endonuclease
MNELGNLGEDLAAKHYQGKGFKLIAKNFVPISRTVGELDLICEKEKTLVFVEVKLRRSGSYGTGAEAVDRFKQRKILKNAKLFLLQNPKYDNHRLRIDVALVDIDKNCRSVTILEDVIEDDV